MTSIEKMLEYARLQKQKKLIEQKRKDYEEHMTHKRVEFSEEMFQRQKDFDKELTEGLKKFLQSTVDEEESIDLQLSEITVSKEEITDTIQDLSSFFPVSFLFLFFVIYFVYFYHIYSYLD